MRLCECGCGQPTPPATHTRRSRNQVKGEPIRFLRGHERRVGQAERFWGNVEKTESCWLWTGWLDKRGYGRDSKTVAHRTAYRMMVGEIPEGHDIHHVCRVRNCVNPAHLEPVTPAEHVKLDAAARTHCRSGHERTPENTYISPDGTRFCRPCNRANVARYNRRKKQAA